MTVRRLLAVFAVLALFLAACGDDGGLVESANESSGDGSSSDGSGDSSGSDDIDLGEIDLGDIDPGDLEAADDFIDNFLPEGCEFFFDFSVAVGLAFGGQGDLSSFDPADAPTEIQDDVRTVLDALEGADEGDFGAVLTDPDIEEALDNIEAFSTANCDIVG